MSQLTNLLRTTLVLAVLATFWTACSKTEQNSLGPTSQTSVTNGGTQSSRTSASSVELYGRVTAIDAGARTMQISGQTATINVAENAQVIFKNGGDETAISLSDIAPGDSLEVRGDFQSTSSFLADRVRKRPNENAQETEFAGRVATLDSSARTMTLVGRPELITVSANAEIEMRAQGLNTAINLADIQPGDSVEIRGTVQTGGVLVDRVRLRAEHVEDGIDAELEFTGSIASIDYAAGTLTVAGRTDLITTDSATIIFGDERAGRSLSSASSDHSNEDRSGKTLIDFANLQVGDGIEIYANRVDPTTLHAVMIKVEDGAFENEMDIEFKSEIASIDVASRVVTFTTAPDLGTTTVAETADLRGLNNEFLTLADFAPGNIVEVKGFKNSDGTVEITRMNKDNAI